MTLVTDLYEQVTGAFSAELSQSNGVTDKNDIEVEKLIVSAEQTQDLVTGCLSSPTTEALGEWMRAAGAASEGAGAEVCKHALLKRFRHPHPMQQHCMLRTYFPKNGEDTPPKPRVHEVVCSKRGRHPPQVANGADEVAPYSVSNLIPCASGNEFE